MALLLLFISWSFSSFLAISSLIHLCLTVVHISNWHRDVHFVCLPGTRHLQQFTFVSRARFSTYAHSKSLSCHVELKLLALCRGIRCSSFKLRTVSMISSCPFSVLVIIPHRWCLRGLTRSSMLLYLLSQMWRLSWRWSWFWFPSSIRQISRWRCN